MKKRLFSILLTLCMVLALMPQMVFADTVASITYLDASGAVQTCDSATVVTSEDTAWGTSGQTTWYVAQGDVNINSRVTVTGDVRLILADGCKLTVNGGIYVRSSWPTVMKLTIYGQEKGAGKLYAYASGGSNFAGIGGGGNKDIYGICGEITINGGNITAVGDGSGEGIGGGLNGAFDYITINGGTVTATGGNKVGSSGIGAYDGGDTSGTITISGGTVMATGKSYGINASGKGTISTGNDGHAVIFASYIDSMGSYFNYSLLQNRNSWGGVIFEGNSGQIYGDDITPSESFEIPSDKTLTIDSGQSLTIPAGKTLTVNGTLTNKGKLYVDGTLKGTGTVDGSGDVYYHLALKDCTVSSTGIEKHNEKTYAKEGSEITLTPDDPPTGYKFDGWEVTSDGTVEIGEGNSFTMPNGAIAVTAKWVKVIPPEIIEGMGQHITEGEKKALSFTSNADFNDFLGVKLDGKTLDAKNYTVKEGSTIVTLDADYVSTLPAGEHTIGIVSTNGTAAATFIIKEKPAADNSSDTGDNTNLPLLIGLMLLSIAGITGMTGYRRRKRTDE